MKILKRDVVWQHQDNNGICHPLQNRWVLFYPSASQLLLWLHWAGPLTAEMAEVSGAHYLYNTTAEENRLFFRLPTAHASRKNCTHCQQERIKVACPNPQAGMDMAGSESVRAGGRKILTPLSRYRANRHDWLCYRKVCLTTHVSGESKCAPYISLSGTKI